MDRKGQALVLFIVLIPIFLILSIVLVDMGINTHNEKKLKNVTQDVMEILLDDKTIYDINYNNREEINENLKKEAERIYFANDIDTDDLFVEVTYAGRIELSNTISHYSFMNSLLGKGNGERTVTILVEGHIYDGEKIIEFKDGSNEN